MHQFLSRKQRESTRKVARRVFVDYRNTCISAVDLKDPVSTQRLRHLLSQGFRNEPAFKSIITSILISLAIKAATALAVKLIENWIKNNLTSPPAGGFQKGEPGA